MTTAGFGLLAPVFVKPQLVQERTASFHAVGCVRRGSWLWFYAAHRGFGAIQYAWTPVQADRYDGTPSPAHLEELPAWSHWEEWPAEQPNQSSGGPFEVEFIEEASGWPQPAFCSWRKTHSHIGARFRRGVKEYVWVRDPIERSGWIAFPARITDRFDGSDGMSFRPIWTGLLIDAAFWSCAWPIVLFGPGAIRGRLRRWRGRCPRCAYDLRAAPQGGCPECGWRRAGPEA